MYKNTRRPKVYLISIQFTRKQHSNIFTKIFYYTIHSHINICGVKQLCQQRNSLVFHIVEYSK